jgi:hypothetical protein
MGLSYVASLGDLGDQNDSFYPALINQSFSMAKFHQKAKF